MSWTQCGLEPENTELSSLAARKSFVVGEVRFGSPAWIRTELDKFWKYCNFLDSKKMLKLPNASKSAHRYKICTIPERRNSHLWPPKTESSGCPGSAVGDVVATLFAGNVQRS
jgi:hypothetical protein